MAVRPTGSAWSLSPDGRRDLPSWQPSPGGSQMSPSTLLFPKKALDKLLARASGQHFSAGHWGWDCPGHRSHRGLSRLADVSGVALNELHLFISAAELWASTRQPFSFHFYLKKSFICHRGGATAKLLSSGWCLCPRSAAATDLSCPGRGDTSCLVFWWPSSRQLPHPCLEH